jgi:hypothetical protein
MRKIRNGGGLVVESIARAIMNSRPTKALVRRVRKHLAATEAERLRFICIMLMAGMLLGDVVLLFRVGDRARAAPNYSAIRTVTTVGAGQAPKNAKEFRQVWDSLMTDPKTKNRWDSLLRIRPGLSDTVRQLEKMDSAVPGK